MTTRKVGVGTVFEGRYEVVGRLGEGGFGEVFRGRQLATGQKVAIKLLHPPPDPTTGKLLAARFQREMKLCAELHHSHIVRLIDSGLTDDGAMFTVFELVLGDTLAAVLERETRLSIGETLHLMGQVLDALCCAHQQGVVHRDLKPHNIMVAASGGRRNATVLDFGIGTYVVPDEQEEEDVTRLTKTSMFVGTPPYAAPEQIRGLSPTPKTDLYAWALIVIECITGERVMRGNKTNIMYQQLGPEPVPIPEEIASQPLGDLLGRALVKNADERRVTAQGLFSELLEIMAPGAAAAVSRVGAAIKAKSRAMEAPTSESAAAGSATASGTSSGLLRAGGVRRQLTLVSCLFTVGGNDDTDPEEFDEQVAEVRELCQQTMARFDGHPATSSGDRSLFYFGLPHAREDDPVRAARAARALVDELARRELATDASGAAIGIHTGLVVVREARDGGVDLGGTSPAIAHGVASRSTGGVILLTEATGRALHDHFETQLEGRFSVDGSSRRMRVYRLADEHDRGASLATRFVDSVIPLVGRDDDLRVLAERWRQARDGRGQGILISGETGIGKSRLAAELVRHVVGGDDRWFEARCHEDNRGAALRPILDLLERLVEIEDDWTPTRKLQQLEAYLKRHNFDLGDTPALLAPLLGIAETDRHTAPEVSPEKLHELTLEALLTLLFGLAEDAPFLLVVEDLHWADSVTVDFLGKLIHEAADAAVCVVVTARPEFAPSWASASLLHIQLTRLDRDGVAGMVAGLATAGKVEDAVIEEIARRTDGVALFVEELTRLLLEGEHLVVRDGRYELPGSWEKLTIPTTLRDILTARIDRLPRGHETLMLAACLGRELDHDVLVAAAKADSEQLEADVDALVVDDILQRRRRRRSVSYSFRHALVRDTVYESLLRDKRRRLHSRIASVLTESFAAAVEARPDILAHHYTEAAEVEPAIAQWIRASELSWRRSANREGAEQLERALALVTKLPRGEGRDRTESKLQSTLGRTLCGLEGYASPRVERAFLRALELTQALGRSGDEMPIRAGLHAHYFIRGNLQAARDECAPLKRLALASGDPREQLHAAYHLGTVHFHLGAFDDATRELAHACSFSTTHEPAIPDDPAVQSPIHLACLRWLSGRTDESVDLGESAMALARGRSHQHALVGALTIGTHWLHTWRRDHATVQAMVGELIPMCMEKGYPWHMAVGSITLGLAQVVSGTLVDDEADTMIATMKGTIDALFAAGAECGRPHLLAMVAEAMIAQRRHEDAVPLLDEGLAVSARTAQRLWSAELHRLRGLAVVGVDEPSAEPLAERRASEGERWFRQALEVARGQNALALELRAATSLVELDRRCQRDQSRSALAAIVERFGKDAGGAEITHARELLDLTGTS